MNEGQVVIWSGEHKAFWRDNAAGYTRYAHKAGRYSMSCALDHVRGAGPEKRLEIIPTHSIPGLHENEGLRAQLSELQEELARKDRVISDLSGGVDRDEPYVTDKRKAVLRRNPDLAHTHEVRRLLNEIDDLRDRTVVVSAWPGAEQALQMTRDAVEAQIEANEAEADG